MITQLSALDFEAELEGVEGMLGVSGILDVPRCFRFQKLVLGPVMMNAKVQRERPRMESG
jgi:hypothetical protein